jgi:hypothetical protein
MSEERKPTQDATPDLDEATQTLDPERRAARRRQMLETMASVRGGRKPDDPLAKVANAIETMAGIQSSHEVLLLEIRSLLRPASTGTAEATPPTPSPLVEAPILDEIRAQLRTLVKTVPGERTTDPDATPSEATPQLQQIAETLRAIQEQLQIRASHEGPPTAEGTPPNLEQVLKQHEAMSAELATMTTRVANYQKDAMVSLKRNEQLLEQLTGLTPKIESLIHNAGGMLSGGMRELQNQAALIRDQLVGKLKLVPIILAVTILLLLGLLSGWLGSARQTPSLAPTTIDR